MQTPPL
jgi:hypothetical protein